MTKISLRTVFALCVWSLLFAAPARAQRANLLPNGSFEDGSFPNGPDRWTQDVFDASAMMTWDLDTAHDGVRSIKIKADTPNDARWIQTIDLKPETTYLLSGWIKTENVEHSPQAVDAGANLCLFGTWQRTAAVFETTDWHEVRMTFNSGPTGTVTIGARLGFWSGVTKGTAWFDDLRVTEILPTDPHPQWKVLVLVYDTTDFTYAEGSITRHVVGHIDPGQLNAAADAATRFVLTDIPALTSQNMIPTSTIRYPGALRSLSPNGVGWWPDPEDTAPERDPAFDSVIVIWQPTVTDQDTGEQLWIGSAAGLTPAMGTDQTYSTLIIEAATLYGHLNVFKHEWGHSILFYFDATGTAPRPTVTNHADGLTYVHCQTGQYYVWEDETDENPIPNSIYNNDSGFTHDYYSGTTALATDPTSCLGITAAAWAAGGPVSLPDPNAPSDTTPAMTAATVSPFANAAGWNNSDVTVGLTAVDNAGGSGVKQVTYGVFGAQFTPTTTVAGNAVFVPVTAEGVSTVAFYATDNAGNGAPANVVTVKLDKTPPNVVAPPDQVVQQASASGAVVTYQSPTIVETGSGLSSASCSPISGSTFPVGSTTVTCSASDLAGNTGSAQFKVTVTATSAPDGLMFGAGFIVRRDEHHHFAFRVAQTRNQDHGRFEYWVNDPRRCGPDDDDRYDRGLNGRHDSDYGRHRDRTSRFEATSISSVVFSDDPRFQPNRGPRNAVDTVHFSGSGHWNGRRGYTFEVSATDVGGSHQKRDTLSLVIKDPAGRVIVSVSGPLERGAIDSTRLRCAWGMSGCVD